MAEQGWLSSTSSYQTCFRMSGLAQGPSYVPYDFVGLTPPLQAQAGHSFLHTQGSIHKHEYLGGRVLFLRLYKLHVTSYHT